MNTNQAVPPGCVVVRRDDIESLRSHFAALYAVATAAQEEYAEAANIDLAEGNGASHETMMFFALLGQATRARDALGALTQSL